MAIWRAFVIAVNTVSEENGNDAEIVNDFAFIARPLMFILDYCRNDL
jgi:hypothetical protein